MSQRYRLTIRGTGMELRGFADGLQLPSFADAMKPFGIVIASPMEGEPDENEPTLEKSIDVVRDVISSADDLVSAIESMARLHYTQAVVIRGEREEKESLQRALHERELHHFETEEILDKIKAARANHPECEKHKGDDAVTCGWKQTVLDIDAALGKA